MELPGQTNLKTIILKNKEIAMIWRSYSKCCNRYGRYWG